MSRRKNIGKYISLEASEGETESEDVDDVVDYKPINIVKTIENKFTESFQVEDDYEDEEEDIQEGLMQSQLLPKNSSPRLFLVRVKRGVEKEIALRIIANKPNICSIIAKDGLRGYLYIEAFQKQHVIDSFGKVRGINKNKISIVPQSEMIDALTYRTDFKSVEFGRIRKGKYKGDLASIIDNDGDMVTIRLVPRINGIKKLFNPEEFKNEAIKRDKNCYLFKKDFYVNGFLEKEVLKSTVDFDAEPNFEELEQFHIRKNFDVGDKVRVTRGELNGIEGVVKSVMGNTVTVQSKQAGLSNSTNSYEVFSDTLEKYYSAGEEVCYKGENGIITNYADGVYFVAIRDFTEEVKVTIDKLSRPIPVTKEIIRKERPKQIFRRDGLINKQVQIRKGKFKGHIGTVKDVYMNKCRIQVNSNLSFITIPREDVKEVSRAEEPQIEYVNEYVGTQSYTSLVHKTPSYENAQTSWDTPTPRGFETSQYKGVLVKTNSEIAKVEDFVGTTFFTDKGTFDKNEVEFVKPMKNENVIIMDGDYKGSMAVVLDIRDELCIVKIKNGLIKNLSIGSVCKHE